jgi:MFS family permease
MPTVRKTAVSAFTLSHTSTFYLLASIALMLLAGSSAPTPLYPHYQEAWHFSPITTTLVFGVYAFAVLLALLVGGRLSDHIGRRPVLIVCTLTSAITMMVFGAATGEGALFVARIMQGLATGAAVSAVGAGLIDLHKARGTIANALAPVTGTALGSLISGLMVHFLPYPTHLIYAVLGIIFVLQGIGVAFMPESISLKAGALASLRPHVALPKALRNLMFRAAPVLIAAWALAGFYASLGPGLIKRIFNFDASLYGGMALFVMIGSGAVAVLVLMHRQALTLVRVGAVALLVGTAGVLLSLQSGSVLVYFLATALAGFGFGAGFQGAIRMVVPLAEPHQRAGVLSVVWLITYLALALPSIGAGMALVQGTPLLLASQYFGFFIMALSIIALCASMMRRPV